MQKENPLKKQGFNIIGHTCAMLSWQCRGELTVDHIQGRDYAIENIGGNKWKIYLQEAKRGLLRPLCVFHNSSQGRKKQLAGFKNKNHHIENRKCFCASCSKISEPSPVFFPNGRSGRPKFDPFPTSTGIFSLGISL